MQPSLFWRCLWFAINLAIVYAIVQFITPSLAGWTYHTFLPLLQIRPSASSHFEFLFSNLVIFSLLPSFLIAILTSRFRNKSTVFVWTVPAAVLAYKIVTYGSAFAESNSVFGSGHPSALHYYFGTDFVISEYHSWREFWDIVGTNPDMLRGLAQLKFTAPFYAGIGYSLSAWICLRSGVDRKIADRLKRWEEDRFGSRGDASRPEAEPFAPAESNQEPAANSSEPR